MSTANLNSQKVSPYFNSVQLNLVLFVDIHKALRNNSLSGCIYAADNGVNSKNQGQANLYTNCKQGQTLNWIIYGLDSLQKPDGSWPPTVKINNLVFLDRSGEDVAPKRITDELAIIGGPDKMRGPNTPVYYYWAATVLGDARLGEHPYRLVLEIDDKQSDQPIYLNSDEDLILNVLPV